MTVTRRMKLAALVLTSAVLPACSAADAHPPPSTESGQIGPPNAANPDPDAGAERCAPRTMRECTQTFHGDDGSLLYCRPSFEFCRADGAGWHKCGRFSKSPKGEMIPPD
ncbi:MAG: hypothetical protein KF819_08910 [Labilithrix sp.]|nr:hypothetical protein [Labilithrix sp.]